MPTQEKARTIEQAKEWYSRSKGVVFTDYRGLKVKELQDLRKAIRSKGGELHVLKNTLFRVAAGEDANLLPYDFHNGPTAVAFIFENEADCTKALLDFAKTNKTLKIKGGFFSGKPVDDKQVQAISELPPRDVLISQVIGAIAAPLSNLVGVIEALYADPIRTIGAVADKVAEGSPIPAKAEAAPVATEAPVAEAAAAEEAPATEAPAEEPATDVTPAEDSAPTPTE